MTRAERILLALVVALVLFSPVFLGGVGSFEQDPVDRPLTALERFLWAHGPSGIIAFLAVAIAAAAFRVSLERDAAGEPSPWRLHRWILLPLAGLAALALLQVVPLPRFLLALLSPRAADQLDLLLPEDASWRPISVSPAGTRSALAGLGIGGAVVLGTLLLSRRRTAAAALLAAVVVAFAGSGLYGLFERYVGDDTILGFPKRGKDPGVTGPFVNRNHMAASAALALPVALALLLGAARRIRTAPLSAIAGTIAAAAAVAVLGATVPLTGSRMGLAAGACGVVAFAFLAARATRWPLWAMALVLLVVAGGVGYGVKTVVERSTAIQFRMKIARMDRGFFDIRFPAWKSTLWLAARYPVLGTGLGTYETAIHETQTPDNPDELVHAHSEPLECLADGGVVGFALFLLLAAGALGAAWSAVGAEDPWIRLVGCGCGAGIAAVLASGAAEFPFRVPCIALAAAVLAAIPAGMAAGEPLPAPAGNGPRRGLPLLLFGVVALAGWGTLDGYRTDSLRGAARRAEQAEDVPGWLAAARAAVEADAGDAGSRRSLAGALLASAPTAARRDAVVAEALEQARSAVDLEPFHPFGHWAVARACLASRDYRGTHASIRRALSRAAGIGHLHLAGGTVLVELHGAFPEWLDEGLDALRTAVECNPMNHTKAAEVLSRQGLLQSCKDRIQPRR